MKYISCKNKLFKIIVFTNFLLTSNLQTSSIGNQLNSQNLEDFNTSKIEKNIDKDLIKSINSLLNEVFKTESIKTAQKALKILEEADPKQKLVTQYYDVYTAIGFVEIRKKNFKKAEKFFIKAYKVIESEKIINDPRLITSLYFLGEVYQLQRMYEKSEKELIRAIEIAEYNNLENSPLNLSSLRSLIITYRSNGQFKKAESTINKSLKIAENLKENRVPTILDFKLRAILNYRKNYYYEKAEEELNSALKISEKFYGEKNFKNLIFLNLYTDVKTRQSKYKEAKFYAEKALEIANSNKISIEYLETLKNLGLVHSLLGNINLSESFYLKFIDHYKEYPQIKDFSKKTIYARANSSLGKLYADTGKFNKAEEFLNKALIIQEKFENKQDYAQTLSTIGSLYMLQGIKDRGKDYFLKALRIEEKIFGKSSLDLYFTLNQLGLSYFYLSENRKAQETYIRNLEILRKNLPESHQKIGTTLANLATSYASDKQYKKAEKIFKERIIIEKKEYGPEFPNLASHFSNLGTIKLEQNKYKESKDYLLKALQIFEKKFGEKSPNLVYDLYSLSKVSFIQKDFEDANNFYERAFKIALINYQKEAPFLIDQDRFDFNFLDNGRFIYSLASESPSLIRNAFLRRLNRQGLIENIEKSQMEIINSASSNFEIYNNYKSLVNELSNINLSMGENNSLEKKKNEIQKEIYKNLPKTKPSILTVENLSNNLNKDELLLEFIRYYPFKEWTNRYDLENPQYIALTLDSNDNVNLFKIGSAINLEKKISEFLSEIKNFSNGEDSEDSAEYKLDEVSNLIFNDSLKKFIQNYKSVFISADWALQRIPISTLRDPDNKNYLSEKILITMIPSSRDLIQKKDIKINLNESVIVANPDFNFSNKDNKKIVLKDQIKRNKLRSKNLLAKKWNSMLGFEIEGKKIYSIIGGELITKKKATPEYLKRLNSPKILHIASHGFYYNYDEDDKNPLKRSGVVLAGANNSNSKSNDDGYLTALEFINMNLKGTELVVISACESGIGDLRFNEGLNGLRRAISVSGAKSSLLSLWKVDDDATTAFMIDFYKNLKEGMYKNKALSLTQKKFRDGIIKSEFGDDWTNIFYWGAFQISGDMSPIEFEN